MPSSDLRVPNFGVFHLNLNDAGILIAKCLWFRGKLEVSFPRTDSIDFNDGELTAALNSQAVKFTELLSRAVQTGTLKAAEVGLNIDERLLPESTFVDALLLASWLEMRGVHLGDVFEDEYLSREAELAERIQQVISFERFVLGREHAGDPENLFLRRELANLEIELARLANPAGQQTTITEKQKNAYLNIIGALLGLLLGSSSSGVPYSQFQNQQAVIDGIHANYGDAPGLSLRNLQEKFAQAKRMLNATNKTES